MKRTRDDEKVVSSIQTDRERVLRALQELVSPLFYDSLLSQTTDALRTLLMTLRQTRL